MSSLRSDFDELSRIELRVEDSRIELAEVRGGAVFEFNAMTIASRGGRQESPAVPRALFRFGRRGRVAAGRAGWRSVR